MRAELPDVAVLDKSKNAPRVGQTAGRHEDFCTIILNDALGWRMFQAAWATVAHCLNEKKPVIL